MERGFLTLSLMPDPCSKDEGMNKVCCPFQLPLGQMPSMNREAWGGGGLSFFSLMSPNLAIPHQALRRSRTHSVPL